MRSDRQGNPLTGATPESVDLFDRAVEAFNRYAGDPVGLLDRAVEAAPAMPMAHLAKAYLFALATEPAATAEAAAILGRARGLRPGEREASHIAALELLLGGEWTAAALALDRHNVRWPLDLVALQAGHLADFYRASGRNLRDRIARVLPRWSADTPGWSYLLGMHAFGLEESGDYGRAEEAGRRALDAEPRDAWAHHAVAHVMEMQGRAEDGIGWMLAREPHWAAEDNFFRVHNWWHRALYHLELGQGAAALALYDGPIRGGRSAVALDLVDASALLWRLRLTGHEVGGRWRELSSAWDAHADGRSYPFNDLHAAMAHLGAGRDDAVERLLAAGRAAADGDGEVAGWVRRTGLPLLEGFAAFWRGDHAIATERLHRARFVANGFGGSHAQRDVVDWTLAEAALRGWQRDLAEALAGERLALKPHSPFNRGLLARSRSTTGG